MKYFTLVLILFSLNVFAGFPPTTIKGDKTSKKETFFDLEVSNKQATKISANKYRIETGNGNMIPDPSFESGVSPTPSFPVNAGDISYECSTAPSVITDPIANDGTKVLKMDYGTGTGINTKRCELYVKIPDNMIGTEVEFSFTGSIKNNSLVCIRSTQTVSPFNLQDGECKNYYDSVADKNKSYVFSIKPLYNVVYLGFYRDSEADTTTNREARLDTIYFGKPKSDEAIVAKFDNTTGMEDCGITASDLVGFGTPTEVSFGCSRNGSRLNIMGYFISGASTATPNTIALKFRGQTLTAKTINNKRMSVGGDGAYGVTRPTAVTVLVDNGANVFRLGRQDSTYSGITNLNGNDLISSGQSISFNATIEIAEWSYQTNAAIVACKEGPLKCTNNFEVTVDGGATTTGLNVPNWITCANTATGIKTCTFNAGMGLANKMNCLAGFGSDGSGETSAGFIQITNQTNTGVTVRTYTTAAAAGNYTVKMTCGKTGTDIYNVDSTVTPMSDMNDVKSTEWVVGYDHIDSKPIYQRCFKFASDVTGTATATNWPTGLNPVKAINHYQNRFGLYSVTEASSEVSTIYYDRSNGNLVYRTQGTGIKVGAGTKVCMEYVK